MAFYINTANDVFEIDDVQIEEKSRVTSFVSGTRSTGKLEYAIDISGDFTIGLYYKSSVTSGYQVDRTIFALTNGTNVFNFFNGWGNDWFMGDETTRTRFSLNNHTVSSTAYEYLVIVRQGTVYNLYRDGILTDSKDFGSSPSFTKLSLGGGYSLEPQAPNGTFDELRIDNIARSSTEISAWYYQGRNGW
jgi:hypothetical protein